MFIAITLLRGCRLELSQHYDTDLVFSDISCLFTLKVKKKVIKTKYCPYNLLSAVLHSIMFWYLKLSAQLRNLLDKELLVAALQFQLSSQQSNIFPIDRS